MFSGLQTACASLSAACRISLNRVGTRLDGRLCSFTSFHGVIHHCMTQLPGALLSIEKGAHLIIENGPTWGIKGSAVIIENEPI
jgi:hypothetical protein